MGNLPETMMKLELTVAALLRGVEPDLLAKVARNRKSLPDPRLHPGSAALIEAYIVRLEAFIAYIQAVDGLKMLFEENPNLLNEISDLETWIFDSESSICAGRRTIVENSDRVGDVLTSLGMSYSQTATMLRGASKLRLGAPPLERLTTLRGFDLMLSRNLSYREVALELCDCGSKTHGELCRERFRKRIADLKKTMSKYGIRFCDLRRTCPDKSSGGLPYRK